MTKYILDKNGIPCSFDEINLDISSSGFSKMKSEIKKEYTNKLNIPFKVYESDSVVINQPYILDPLILDEQIQSYKTILSSILLTTIVSFFAIVIFIVWTTVGHEISNADLQYCVLGSFILLAFFFRSYVSLKVRCYEKLRKLANDGSLTLTPTQINIYDSGKLIKSEFLFKRIR